MREACRRFVLSHFFPIRFPQFLIFPLRLAAVACCIRLLASPDSAGAISSTDPLAGVISGHRPALLPAHMLVLLLLLEPRQPAGAATVTSRARAALLAHCDEGRIALGSILASAREAAASGSSTAGAVVGDAEVRARSLCVGGLPAA